MEQIALDFDPEEKDQIMVIDLEPNGNAITLQLQLTWREYIEKYVMTITDVATGEVILSNFPITASSDGIATDLIRQIAYKGIGSLYCGSIVNEPTYADPRFGTLGEFELIWGDSPWTD